MKDTSDDCTAKIAELSAELGAFKMLCTDRFAGLDKLLVEKEKLRDQRDANLKELIDRSSDVADTNHNQLREVIDLGRREIHAQFEQMRREQANYREKVEEEARSRNARVDKELSTLREGRSTDKGFRTGTQPFLAIGLAIITALLVTALTNFFFNAGRSIDANEPAQTQKK